ncbi:MAG: TonB-dependent receptor, partial [Bacteroidales bacterium]
WRDKGLVKSFGQYTANIPGVNAQHWGVEVEGKYKPLHNLDLTAMFSFGDWIWMDNVEFTMYDENQKPVGDYNAYIKGVHVGNSAQMTAALGVNWNPFKNLRLSADWTWAGKNYADFDPTNRTKPEDDVDSWRMPNFATLDLGISYSMKIAGLDARIFGNAYNVTNTNYIADARDGAGHNAATALVYYGFGPTWATGIRVNF